MYRYVKLALIPLLAAILLVGCSGEDEAKKTSGNDDNSKNEAVNDEAANEQADENEEKDTKDEKADQSSDDNKSKGVAPSSASEQISYTQVTWFGGSPDRQADPGVWYYTEEDHPSEFEDTFDWEKEDILLWQIGDDQYAGYSADTKKLEITDDDLIKIVVSFDEDGPSDIHPDRMPRNFLKVEKGALDGKSFLVETKDGEELSLQ